MIAKFDETCENIIIYENENIIILNLLTTSHEVIQNWIHKIRIYFEIENACKIFFKNKQ